MKSTASTQNGSGKAPTKTASTSPANVPITTMFTSDVFSRITKCKKDKGFLTDQELIRLAVVSFLDRSGF